MSEANDESPPILLRGLDPSTKTIECYAHSFAKIENDDNRYVVAIPCDPCVEICALDPKTEELITIEEDDPAMDVLFPLAANMLEEDDLVLIRSATTLTMQGDLEIEGEDEEEDDEFPEDEEIASFEHEDKQYIIIKVGMPLLLTAKAPNSEVGGSEEGYRLLGDEENEKISAIVQKELDDQFNIQVE